MGNLYNNKRRDGYYMWSFLMNVVPNAHHLSIMVKGKNYLKHPYTVLCIISLDLVFLKQLEML